MPQHKTSRHHGSLIIFISLGSIARGQHSLRLVHADYPLPSMGFSLGVAYSIHHSSKSRSRFLSVVPHHVNPCRVKTFTTSSRIWIGTCWLNRQAAPYQKRLGASPSPNE